VIQWGNHWMKSGHSNGFRTAGSQQRRQRRELSLGIRTHNPLSEQIRVALVQEMGFWAIVGEVISHLPHHFDSSDRSDLRIMAIKPFEGCSNWGKHITEFLSSRHDDHHFRIHGLYKRQCATRLTVDLIELGIAYTFSSIFRRVHLAIPLYKVVF
jgi:hypothetical protein